MSRFTAFPALAARLAAPVARLLAGLPFPARTALLTGLTLIAVAAGLSHLALQLLCERIQLRAREFQLFRVIPEDALGRALHAARMRGLALRDSSGDR